MIEGLATVVSDGGKYRLNCRGVCLDSSRAFIISIRALMSISERSVCEFAILVRRLLRLPRNDREAVVIEGRDEPDDDDDEDDEESDEDLFPRAHRAIACSTTVAMAPNRLTPRKEEPEEDEEEEDEDEVDEDRLRVTGRSPR